MSYVIHRCVFGECLGETMLANLLKVSDEELAFTGDDQKTHSPPWMSILAEQSSQWLKLLPTVCFQFVIYIVQLSFAYSQTNFYNSFVNLLFQSVAKLKRSVDNIKDPLFRFFEREINHGIHLLARVRSDLIEVRQQSL